MATYSTDLTTLTTAESGTWTEFTSANSGGTPAADGENYIQGTNCYSQTTGTKSGTANPKSVVYQHGSDLSGTWVSGDAVFLWTFYAVGANLYDFDQTTYSGYEIGIGADITNVDRFFVGGADWGRNPYGGWANFAVDPEVTPSTTYGTGGAGYQYFGGIAYTINAISKGTPHAIDAIRYGRGIISVTGTGGSFAELASYNDYNLGGTPPGTSSTSVDAGYHRLGLFQEQGGTYLWKGLLSLGTSGASVTFSDANETIIIDDVIHATSAFNKVEVRNSSSSVTLQNVTFISIATAGTVALGNFEVVDNATLSMSGCSFNDMGTFTFNGGANPNTLSRCTFNSCGAITQGGATFNGCTFNTSTSPFVASNISTVGATTACTFNGNGTTTPGHAVNLGTISATTSYDWYNILDNGANQTVWEGSATTGRAGPDATNNNAAILVNIASGQTLTIDVKGSGSIPTVYNTGSGTLIITAGQKTLTLTGIKADSSANIAGGAPSSEVRIYSAGTTTELDGIENVIETTPGSKIGTFGYTYTYAANTYVDIVIHHLDYKYYRINNLLLENGNSSIPISQIPDRNYSNP